MPACASARLLPALEEAGISTVRIAQAAGHLARAREALDAETARFLARHAHVAPGGRTLLDGSALRAEPREIGLRALSAILLRVSGQTYRPRFERLEHLYDSLGRSAGLTLSGCRIGPAPKEFRHFGTATLEIRRETPRRPIALGNDEARKKPRPETAMADAKLPKKRRIIGRLSGS